MPTETETVAQLEGKYRCDHCLEECQQFAVGDTLTPCSKCTTTSWICYKEDNIPLTDAWFPVCFGYGTMTFVVPMLGRPNDGDQLNMVLVTDVTAGSKTTRSRYIDGRFRIGRIKDHQLPSGYDAVIAHMEAVGPIDPTEYTFWPVAAAF